MQPAPTVTPVQGEYLILEVYPPGEEAFPAGVLLLDPRDDRLHLQFLNEFPDGVSTDDREVLSAITADISARAKHEGAEAILRELESSFSHILRLTPRTSVLLHQPERQISRLFAQHVVGSPQQKPKGSEVIPFRTHLPYYPMRIAAGAFDGDMEVEAGGWVPVPAGVRPDRSYFVARITGHSMEPRVPDGSFCLFKANPQGSREGKLLLVQKFGASDSGGEFTIKRYHSEKASIPTEDAFGDDVSWSHSRVRLISLNPDYPSWDLAEGECKVIAEFVRVLDDAEVPDDIRED